MLVESVPKEEYGDWSRLQWACWSMVVHDGGGFCVKDGNVCREYVFQEEGGTEGDEWRKVHTGRLYHFQEFQAERDWRLQGDDRRM